MKSFKRTITVLDVLGWGVAVCNATPPTWGCIDCGRDTAPGMPNRNQLRRLVEQRHGVITVRYDSRNEVYQLKRQVWRRALMWPGDGCLCIGCVERRLGRRLTPKDFNSKHQFAKIPGTRRLLSRRD